MSELNNTSNARNYFNSADFIRVTLYGDKNFDVTNFKTITATINNLLKPRTILKKLFF